MKSSENLSSADNQQERSKEFLRGYVTLVSNEWGGITSTA